MLLRILLICLFSFCYLMLALLSIFISQRQRLKKRLIKLIDQIQGASDSRENTDETHETGSSEQKEPKPVEPGKSQSENEQENRAEKQGESTMLKKFPPFLHSL
jgi:hypothetical protein